MSNDGGIQKAAILMLALGESEAAEVMKFLGPREVLKLGAAMATMKAVQHEQVVDVLEAFRGQTELNSTVGLDSDEYIRQVLTKALGDDKASVLLNRILGGNPGPPRARPGVRNPGQFHGPPAQRCGAAHCHARRRAAGCAARTERRADQAVVG
jgi:hypothetical protein